MKEITQQKKTKKTDNLIFLSLHLKKNDSSFEIQVWGREEKKEEDECDSAACAHLLLGFGGVALDWLPCHQWFQSLLHSADLLRLDVQLQGEERLQSGRLFRVLLIHHGSAEGRKEGKKRHVRDQRAVTRIHHENFTVILYGETVIAGCLEDYTHTQSIYHP